MRRVSPLIDGWWQDLRYASRRLRGSPAFTTIAALTLGLGIGVIAALFSVIRALVLLPLPYHDPGRLVVLWTDDPKHDSHQEGTSYPTWSDWRARNHSFVDLAYVGRGRPPRVVGRDGPEQGSGAEVSANLFPLLGRTPVVGRGFSSEDEQTQQPIAVIGYGLWQRRFGGRSTVLGELLDTTWGRLPIVGVMPRGFSFPDADTEYWFQAIVPEALRHRRFTDTFMVIGRLKPGIALRDARRDMTTIGQQLARAYPTTDEGFAGFDVNIVPMLDQMIGRQLHLGLWILLGAVGCVLINA